MLQNNQCRDIIKKTVLEENHPEAPPGDIFQPTSVIALFAPEEEMNMLMIQKADIEGYPWRNQMAFPGGNCEPDDPSREATALRELHEEMAIPSEDVEVLGSIGHFQTINHKDIEAFLGIWNKNGAIHFDTSEIARVFRIPLMHFVEVHTKRNFSGRLPGINELIYPYENVEIWGVTAKIIHHFMEILIPNLQLSC